MISYMQQFKSDANLSSTTKICFLCETGVGCCNVFPTGTEEYNSDVKIDFGGRVEGTVREAWMGCMSGGRWGGVGLL